MIKCVIPCTAAGKCLKEIEQSLASFSQTVADYGFSATLSYSDPERSAGAIITLLVDDEMIEAKKGAKRGPKEKATNISIEEMEILKKQGLPPREIAKLAGIGVATYFRRMAAHKAQMAAEESPGREEL